MLDLLLVIQIVFFHVGLYGGLSSVFTFALTFVITDVLITINIMFDL